MLKVCRFISSLDHKFISKEKYNYVPESHLSACLQRNESWSHAQMYEQSSIT
jgi:hypothetical protein